MSLLVTIVIPAYNHAGYLDRAIRSVLAQTYARVELIVLDDGSTDGTRALLEGYGNAFRWASHANMGQARTLNKGWEMSSGAYLAYLSADDELHPEAAAAAVQAFEAHPEAAVVYPDTALIDPQSRSVYLLASREYAHAEMVRLFVSAVGVGAFFRRDAWEKSGGWNPQLARMPDLDFWLRIGLHGPLHRIPRALGLHRVHAGSETYARPSAEKADESLRIIKDFYEIRDLPAALLAVRAQACASASLLSARLHLYAGRVATGLRRYVEALALDPSLLYKPRGYRAVIVGLLGRLRWWVVSAIARR